MWRDPADGKDCSKKRFRQMTIAQAFSGYNKKLKIELDQGSATSSNPLTEGGETSRGGQAKCSLEVQLDSSHGSDDPVQQVHVADKGHGVDNSGKVPEVITLDSTDCSEDLPKKVLVDEAKNLVEKSGSISKEEIELGSSDDWEVTGKKCSELQRNYTAETEVVSTQGDLSQASVDLFPDLDVEGCSPCSSGESTDVSDQESADLSHSFLTSLNSPPPLGLLRPTGQHSVLFSYLWKPGEVPRPYPKKFVDAWDGDNVRMPCSQKNVYPVKSATGERRITSRWQMIRDSFSAAITCSTDLEEAILQYNSQYSSRWNFQALHSFFTETNLEAEEVEVFFGSLLPKIVSLALDLPNVCTQPIPLLKRHRERSLTLSQKQIACLLANAFLCTFPRRNTFAPGSEYEQYPSINFNSLYAHSASRRHQKILCFLNYFRRVTASTPTGAVTFRRQCLRQFPDWRESSTSIRRCRVHVRGTIEREGAGMLQVDFANKFVGGGVLNTGLVQEEIRFIVCPELVVSRLFTECLDATEALLVTGCEQFNAYSGYGDTFVWEDDFKDQTPRDSWGRRLTSVVAVDAVPFTRDADQYRPHFLRREVNKAYAGFFEAAGGGGDLPAVATGNWGCGVFGGDARLKSLIQLVAASVARRDVVYFTFGDEELAADIGKMVRFLRGQSVTVGQLWTVLEDYYESRVARGSEPISLYQHIYIAFGKAAPKRE